MSRHDPAVTLRQVAEFALLAAQLGADGSRAELEINWRYRLAAERAAELIGEAVARLPMELRERHSQVPWREIIAFRNRLIHGYDAVDLEILWDVLQHYAPALEREIAAILAAENQLPS